MAAASNCIQHGHRDWKLKKANLNRLDAESAVDFYTPCLNVIGAIETSGSLWNLLVRRRSKRMDRFAVFLALIQSELRESRKVEFRGV